MTAYAGFRSISTPELLTEVPITPEAALNKMRMLALLALAGRSVHQELPYKVQLPLMLWLEAFCGRVCACTVLLSQGGCSAGKGRLRWPHTQPAAAIRFGSCAKVGQTEWCIWLSSTAMHCTLSKK